MVASLRGLGLLIMESFEGGFLTRWSLILFSLLQLWAEVTSKILVPGVCLASLKLGKGREGKDGKCRMKERRRREETKRRQEKGRRENKAFIAAEKQPGTNSCKRSISCFSWSGSFHLSRQPCQ